MKKLLMSLLATVCLLGATASFAADTAPKSVIHVVTVAFKPDATDAQIKAAVDGVRALPASFKGITRVWTKAIKIQDAKGAEVKKTHVFVMEFASEAALKEYGGSDAQKAWYQAYSPIRLVSTTFDITN